MSKQNVKMEASDISIPSPEKPWITISVAGATAGAIVAAITFAATNTATSALATGSGFTIEALGEAAGMGTAYFMGPAAGYSVKIVSKAFSKTAENSVRQTGLVTSGIISAVAGAVTSLSITAGTHIVNYSIEYGGKISKEVAIKISESYLKYKMQTMQFKEKDVTTELLLENDWVLLEEISEPDALDESEKIKDNVPESK